jgi:sugar/nucleoside kinase (ribokinase family)
MSQPFDVLVAGEINPDLILSGDVVPEFGQVEKLVESAALTIGSSSAIFACGAARLGLKVAFTGVCGDDVFGRFMLAEMSQRGVDVSNVIQVPGGTTGLSVILNRPFDASTARGAQGDRAILTHLGLISALKAEDVADNLLRQSRHLHVAGYYIQDALRPGLPALFDRAHALGLTTSLDTNYDPTESWTGLPELLARTDIFFPNEKEALSICRAPHLDTALAQLASQAKLVALKRGADGASAQTGATVLSVPSIPVNVVDTVGAGDSFDAGFIYGYLNGWPLEKTLRLAAICGALSTQSAGGTAAQATLPEALKHVPD